MSEWGLVGGTSDDFIPDLRARRAASPDPRKRGVHPEHTNGEWRQVLSEPSKRTAGLANGYTISRDPHANYAWVAYDHNQNQVGRLATEPDPEGAWVADIDVHPDHQRKGVARAMWEAAGRPAHTPDTWTRQGESFARAVGGDFVLDNGIRGKFPNRAAASYTYLRNNNGVRENSPTGYDQDIEPWGRYMNPGHGPSDLAEGWERGHVEFDNPLHMDEDNWKHNLSQQYGGATGQALSDALLADGYDGVMTSHPRYGPGEMVDVRPRDQRRHRTASEVPPEWQGYYDSMLSTPDVSNTAHAMMPIEMVNHYREYQRNTESLNYQVLKSAIQEHGNQIRTPLLMSVNETHGLLNEGNHRAAIAAELGITHVPVRFQYDKEVRSNDGTPVSHHPNFSKWLNENLRREGARTAAPHLAEDPV